MSSAESSRFRAERLALFLFHLESQTSSKVARPTISASSTSTNIFRSKVLFPNVFTASLGKRFYVQGDWTFDLNEIAFDRVGLSRSYTDAGKIKEKLQPAIDELEASVSSGRSAATTAIAGSTGGNGRSG